MLSILISVWGPHSVPSRALSTRFFASLARSQWTCVFSTDMTNEQCITFLGGKLGTSARAMLNEKGGGEEQRTARAALCQIRVPGTRGNHVPQKGFPHMYAVVLTTVPNFTIGQPFELRLWPPLLGGVDRKNARNTRPWDLPREV